MKTNRIYFSPTGSTEAALKLVAGVWEGEQQDVDFSLAGVDYTSCHFKKDELCLIGVPSFGGRVPAVAVERLRQMKAEGTPTVLLVSFGNRDYDDTLLELKDTVSQSGFHVVAAIAAVTEHSIMHQFGANRPDASDKEALLEYANRMKQALAKDSALPEIAVKGATPYKEYNGVPFKPSADKSCTKCGICARSCPVGAIPPERPAETHKELCISCMRCISVCPQHARKVNSVVLFAAGKAMQKACGERKNNEFFFGEIYKNPKND